jgi:hypothetical protein
MEEPDLRSLKKKWVEALRSGEYQQGEGHLFKDDSYCCLGVLCKVAGATFGGEHPVMRENEDGELYPTTADARAYISPEVWAEEDEFPDSMQAYFGLGQRVHGLLVEMNDGRGMPPDKVGQKTFSEIADWIETHDLRTGNELPSEAGGVAAIHS